MKQKQDKIKFYLKNGKTVYSADKVWELSVLLPKDDIVKEHMQKQENRALKGLIPNPIEVILPEETFDALKEGIIEVFPKIDISTSIELTAISGDFVIVKYTYEKS